MKTLAWAFGLALFCAPAAMAQTNEELVKGATDTNNVGPVQRGGATRRQSLHLLGAGA